MDIRAKLAAAANVAKDWQAVWIMPNGDCRTFRAPSEGQGNSWLTRNVDNHGGEGYVEFMPA